MVLIFVSWNKIIVKRLQDIFSTIVLNLPHTWELLYTDYLFDSYGATEVQSLQQHFLHTVHYLRLVSILFLFSLDLPALKTAQYWLEVQPVIRIYPTAYY